MSGAIESRVSGFKPKVAVILGSGLGGFAEDVKQVAARVNARLGNLGPARAEERAGFFLRRADLDKADAALAGAQRQAPWDPVLIRTADFAKVITAVSAG